MVTQRAQLMPGVWLTAIRTAKFKSSYWSLQLLTPLREDTAALNAVLPYVLRRGTEKYPDLTALNGALDELYGGAVEPTLRKCGDIQCVGFEASFLEDRCLPQGESILESAAALMGSLLLRPAMRNGRFIAAYVDSEKENLIHRILSLRNDKRVYAGERLLEEMCQGEIYAVSPYGTLARAEKISAQRLFPQYQALLEQSPIELFYCGNAQFSRVSQAWREALMGLPRFGVHEVPYTVCLKGPGRAQPKEVREYLDVVQGKLELGFRTGVGITDPMYPAITVANALFGGSPVSRLFLNVREKESLCYYAVSRHFQMKGFVQVSSGVDPAQFDRAREEIFRQLDDVKQGNFTEEEFLAARRSVVNRLRSNLDEQHRLADHWLVDRCSGANLPLEELIRLTEDVTSGQVAAAAMELEPDTVYYLAPRQFAGEEEVPE